MSDTVIHDPAQNRYVLERDGAELGQTVYELVGHDIRFLHTEIDPKLQEHGLGTTLVTGALDQVRSETEFRVVALCPFVARFIAEHPDYQDLTSR